jgi:hypothetical protein
MSGWRYITGCIGTRKVPQKRAARLDVAVAVGAAEDDARAFVDMAKQLTDWYCPRPVL